MREFDLAAAKAGAAVCTRCGFPVRIICLDARNEEFPIVAMVLRHDEETPQLYRTDGGWTPYNTEYDQDLMMRDDDYAEKLARGEYTPSIKEKLTVEDPTCKESLPVDWEYWRRVYAGQAMQGQISGYLASGSGFNGDKSIPGIVAKNSVMIADALIAELEKTEK